MGITLREVIYGIGGGPSGKAPIKAVQTGGPSGGCIPAEMFDLPIDYDSLKAAGSIMGSGGMIVLDEATCMVDLAKYFMGFLKDESCGKCFPCRKGTQRMHEIEGMPVHLALGKRAGRVALEAAVPLLGDQGLGDDRPRRVSGAQEENVVDLVGKGFGHGSVPQQEAHGAAGPPRQGASSIRQPPLVSQRPWCSTVPSAGTCPTGPPGQGCGPVSPLRAVASWPPARATGPCRGRRV